MHKGIPCELISWERFYQLARKLARMARESGFQFDMIVAIGRGGYMPARILSDHLAIFDLTSIKVEHYHGVRKERVAKICYPLTAQIAGKRVLLVDDVSDSGSTFQTAVRHLREHGEPAELRTAVLHHKRVSSFVPDHYVEEVLEWRWIIYPWAVIEDLTNFLQEMEPRPSSTAAFAAYLLEQHAIEPPEQLLRAVQRLQGSMQEQPDHFENHPRLHEVVGILMGYLPLVKDIEAFWLDSLNQQADTWKEHLDINTVMLATSLAPDGFLTV